MDAIDKQFQKKWAKVFVWKKAVISSKSTSLFSKILKEV
jgi:hypothetical protein